MKKIISTFLLCCITLMSAKAVEFDSSIDNDIRKNYKVEENELPALPSVPNVSPSNQNEQVEISKIYNPSGKTYKIKSGTKIALSSKSAISDWQAEGTKISFTSINGITTKEGNIIPAGTIYKGVITDSHRPQITGNGGLVELKIDEIYYNGVRSRINTKIINVNEKKVFHSDIKGKRGYLKNFSKVMTPGRKIFHGTQTFASALYPIPVINILSIVPITVGAACYLVNFTIAPAAAIFGKGGSVSIPAGTQFLIKVTEDSQING